MPKHRKDPAAVKLGRKGGKASAIARMKKMTAAERSALARKAAMERWRKAKKSK